ncbi:PREDICTED: stAR-related lipid transfer protein 7, mitochondrial-like [Priapulus caudatus]|uniref:StAR-related lipid transfer protein 7, mitochondrial-like n=1 Tax=Priapulus caudatus TaxID=37621 RepID=A0ABM1EW67_PRICU|nr:PREDICTED: stAR-related lipid transfer protein 7, mitochondrial-like [Priapulus caudatus]XP_014676439.1 PREDICTED: stAR-related lipid transfer protein 7, mitochondrial-like [Priapulus caudatus]XP_014676440.1 PREDICTED: stAR-related lipid transfer protein 7, mitochondrial-like [Priapulus caudatus]
MLIKQLATAFRKAVAPSVLLDRGIVKEAVHNRAVHWTDAFRSGGWRSTRISAARLKKLRDMCDEKCLVIGRLLTRQCEVYVAQRIRHFMQIIALYRRLYTEQTLRRIVAGLGRSLSSRSRVGFALSAALFSWDNERISEEDMERVVADMEHIEHLRDPDKRFAHYMDQWELMIDEAHLKLWRRPLPDCNYLYEYKVYGTFYDVPSIAFYMVQIDCEYRKQWDRLVIALDVIDTDDESGSEVVHWVTKYPYPMYSRDYVYSRRGKVDDERGVMVLVARAVEHPQRPATDSYVRVSQYVSQMVIRPHRGFTDCGFDYTLTYSDDPQAPFPGPAYRWLARKGVPDFVEKLHVAAKMYQDKQGGQKATRQQVAEASAPSGIQINYAA